MKSSGIQALNRQKALDNYVQEESIALKNQIATLQTQLLEKEMLITSQSYTINQTNSQLTSLQNTVSAKNNEIGVLQQELNGHKNTKDALEQSLTQKDNVINRMSKNIDDMRLEKQQIKEDKQNLCELLSSTEAELKQKTLQIQALLSIYPDDDDQESNLSGENSFEVLND